MKLLGRAVIPVAMASAVCLVRAEVFSHVDPATGRVTLSNHPPRSRQPKPAVVHPHDGMGSPVGSAAIPGAEKGKTASAGSGRPDAVARFPAVSPAAQARRDHERRQILVDELKAEQKALEAAAANRLPAEVLHHHRANISALEREIASLNR